MTATQESPVTTSPHFLVSYDQLETHRKDMDRRQAERDARRPELLLCCNPAYASRRELEKPQFVWTVDVEWYSLHPQKGPVNFHRKMNVVAQTESDAWALWCDKNEVWPSPRDVKVTFKKGKQLSASQVASQQSEAASLDGIPKVEFQPKNEKEHWREV